MVHFAEKKSRSQRMNWTKRPTASVTVAAELLFKLHLFISWSLPQKPDLISVHDFEGMAPDGRMLAQKIVDSYEFS